MKTLHALFGLSFLSLSILAGCGRVISGSGHLIEVRRDVASFSGVGIHSDIHGEASLGAPSVALRIDDNLEPYMITELVNGVLRVHTPDDVEARPIPGASISVSSPLLQRLEISGNAFLSGAVNGDDALLMSSGASMLMVHASASHSVTVEASGNSHVELDGTAPSLLTESSGSAHIESTLPGNVAEIEASGESEVTARAAMRVRVRASGTSRVTIDGNPSERDVETSGNASVGYSQ